MIECLLLSGSIWLRFENLQDREVLVPVAQIRLIEGWRDGTTIKTMQGFTITAGFSLPEIIEALGQCEE